ncbi:C-C motif chemokine 27 [Hyperolius riggenbachi]|uniref:C-C motif chemokine 27 n=1 Tax=Hyperolius riggenbachi TaxID=752182 RepID=UPI0035A383D3
MSPLRLLTAVALAVVIMAAVCQGMPTHSVSCCTKLAKNFPKNLLKQVTKVRFQKKDGVCNLRAIVLYIGNQQKCVDPQNKTVQTWIKKNRPAKHL